MNDFDTAILRFCNAFAQRWPELDRLLGIIAVNDLFKGVVVAGAFSALWFTGGDAGERERRRRLLLATLLGTLAALAVNRTLASLLPHRVRPLQDPELGFVLPAGMSPLAFSHLSAFPSDHAVMFLGMAFGMLRVSARAGVLLLLHAVIVVLLPRIYLGLHYPTDLIGGAALALLLVGLATSPGLARRLARGPLAWERRHPPSFYAVLFLAMFGLATLFHPAVELAWGLQRLGGR